jgi:hypothetical protein
VARKNAADSAKEKAAKQKKMAIGLSVVLALAMAYAVHTMIGMGGGAASAPQAADTTATVTASTPPAAAPVTPSAPAAPSLGSVAPAATTAAAASAQLVSAVPQSAGTGQLQSFSRFESKDPFNAGGPSAGTTAKQPSSSSSGGTPKAPKAPPAPPAPPAAPAPAPTNAVISVNGSSETVASGSNFPAANPVFELISLTATTAKVSVVGGSYASGSATLTLKVNKAVTLVNTADGTRYVIVLMPQGTLPSSSGSSASPPAGTTTTP